VLIWSGLGLGLVLIWLQLGLGRKIAPVMYMCPFRAKNNTKDPLNPK